MTVASKREAFEAAIALAMREARNEPSRTAARMAYRIARYIREDLLAKEVQLVAADAERSSEVQHCPKCGSANCQTLAWIRVNGSELIADADAPSDEVYCPTCRVTFHYAELKEG